MGGVRPDAATFTSLALPHARRGAVDIVKRYIEQLRHSGLAMNGFSYSCLILAHARQRPRNAEAAEAVFREMVGSGVKSNRHAIKFLREATGASRARQIAGELNIDFPSRFEGRNRRDNSSAK